MAKRSRLITRITVELVPERYDRRKLMPNLEAGAIVDMRVTVGGREIVHRMPLADLDSFESEFATMLRYARDAITEAVREDDLIREGG